MHLEHNAVTDLCATPIIIEIKIFNYIWLLSSTIHGLHANEVDIPDTYKHAAF